MDKQTLYKLLGKNLRWAKTLNIPIRRKKIGNMDLSSALYVVSGLIVGIIFLLALHYISDMIDR